VGVPARYVRGYVRAQREDGVYRLLESDGHAWPEVFFPGYGWVEFEPTGGQPALLRPRSQDPGEEPDFFRDPEDMPRPMDEEMDHDPGPTLTDPDTRPQWLRVLERFRAVAWVALVLAGVGLIAVMAYRFLRERQLEGLSSAERVYFELVSWARRLLRLEPLAHQTPNEYAGAVAEMVPQGRLAVEEIAGFYVQERFGGRKVSPETAVGAWKQAWTALWRRWIENRTEGLRRIWWKLVPPRGVAEE
jgi:hypothetical protein